MQTTQMSPLFAFAIAMAYIARADGDTGMEEKARITALFAKHARRGDVDDDGLKIMARDAFEFAATVPMKTYLGNVTTLLTRAQKLTTVFNLYDLMLADGKVHPEERKVINAFATAFGIGSDTLDGLRDVLMTKNDTTVLTDNNHPLNARNHGLSITVVRE